MIVHQNVPAFRREKPSWHVKADTGTRRAGGGIGWRCGGGGADCRALSGFPVMAADVTPFRGLIKERVPDCEALK